MPLKQVFATCLCFLMIPTADHVFALDKTEAIRQGLVDQSEDRQKFQKIDQLIRDAIDEGKLPGAVVMIGNSQGVIYCTAVGDRLLEPKKVPLTHDTVFDLASLTKPIVTGTCVLILAQQGLIDPTAPASQYLPEFTGNGKEEITIDQLLSHTSGLIADNSIRDYQQGPEIAWERICSLKLQSPPGESFVYSDVGYIVLGRLIEQVSGLTLQDFAKENLFQPLMMHETGYLPAEKLKLRAAPTEKKEDVWIQGTVHDPRAAAMGGVAGHAGLFSTAADLVRYAQMILNRGELNGIEILKPETIDAMLTSRPVGNDRARTWGWDRQTGFSSNKGKGMSDRAIGHGGFTGTGLWIDPDLDLFVIFLSSRLYPDGQGAVNPLIGQIGTIAVETLKDE